MTATTAPSNGDVLAAASLLLAILAVLYSLWYADIDAALRVEKPTHLEDARSERRQVRQAIRTRAAPLAFASVVLFLVFLPEAVRLIVHWVSRAIHHGLWHEVRSYSAVELSIVAVVLALAALAAYSQWLLLELLRTRRKLG